MSKQYISFAQLARRIKGVVGDSLLDYDPESWRKPTVQVGLPDRKAKWVSHEDIGGLLGDDVTSTPRK